MTIWARGLRRIGRGAAGPRETASPDERVRRELEELAPVEIAPNDPALRYFQEVGSPVALEGVALDSPAIRALRAAGVVIVVPLISQGELIGLLNLGPRLSEQEYSADDRQLLERLASQAAPALRVAQLVREQQAELRQRERLDEEMRVAQLIQQQFLPRKLPDLPGWNIAAFYRPARDVGGDFYDFIELPDGEIGLVVGDVTGKGVPAALVMATTRSILRSEAPRLVTPARVLARANELLASDIPSSMFVTCFYAVLDPRTGRIRYANAGHTVPYVRGMHDVEELRARGMPLGLMPGMTYDEKEAILPPGASLLMHSDGLGEAHSSERKMFGFGRVRDLVCSTEGGQPLIDALLSALDRHAGGEGQQEDDITLVTVVRAETARDLRLVGEFETPSVRGNERLVMERVAGFVDAMLPRRELERLKTAVSEAAMNAIEHGNKERPELPVAVQVLASEDELVVRVTDRGGGQPIPAPETPDIEAKLAGLQKPRGWGLFLIKNMVDDMRVTSDDTHHTVELVVRKAVAGGAA